MDIENQGDPVLSSEGILRAVSYAARRFLESQEWEQALPEVLEQIGKGAEVSRVFIFQNLQKQDNQLYSNQRFEWVASGISPQIDNPHLQQMYYEDNLYQRFGMVMSRGDVLQVCIKDLQPEEREIFDEQDVKSIIVAPIFVRKEWWGFIGFDDCITERKWSPAEAEALQAAAGIIGSAIERSRAGNVLLSTVRISEAAQSTRNLDELYRSIHLIISDLMPAKNFYIALQEPDTGFLNFPYFVDERDEYVPRWNPGRGMTAYVLRSGKPVCANPEVFERLEAEGEVDRVGAPSIDWIGVPLKTQEKIIGVLAVQSYNERERLGEVEKDILVFVSTQIAMAIERKMAEEKLKTSEERYRSLVENIPIGVYRHTPGPAGKLLMANPTFLAMFGYESLEQLQKFQVEDLFLRPEDRENFSKAVLSDGSVSGVEYMFKRKDGIPLWGSVTARVIYGENREISYFDCAITDITDLKWREREREILISISKNLRTATERLDMLSIILANQMELVQLEAAAFLTWDPSQDDILIELASGKWAHLSGQRVSLKEGVYWDVVSSGQIYYSNVALEDLARRELSPFTGLAAVACVPLIVQGQTFGMTAVGRSHDITRDELRILSAVADMSASAVHRAALHEQTQRRVQRLAALRAVDMAISASMDLRVALNVLLDQLTIQLDVDAAAVLLLNPTGRTLDFATGRGFRSNSIQRSRVRLGEGVAGRAVLERRTFQVPDLSESASDFVRDRMIGDEYFVSYYAVPLVAKGQLKGLLEIYHRSLLNPDAEWVDFLETLAGQCAIAIDNASLFNDLQHSNMELALAYDTTLEGWVRALDLRNKEANGHTQRVIDATLRLARGLGKNDDELVHLRRGALLHDIGMIQVPEDILLKPGPLNDTEWEAVRRHPTYANNLLSSIVYLRPALDIPSSHHERWDGSGYPRSLKGEQIPLAARIFAVVDAWDSLRSDRPFRRAWNDYKAREYLMQQAGCQFDPQVISIFFSRMDTGETF